MVPIFKNAREMSTAKNYCPVSLLSVLVKSLKNLQTIDFLTTWRDVAFFLIYIMALGLLNQLQIV